MQFRKFFMTLALVFIAFPAMAEGVSVGQQAPDFTLKSVNGEDVKLSDYRGKTVVLEWTNHECPYVKKHYGTDNMQTLQQEVTADGGVWLTIVSSAPGHQGHTTAEEAKKIMMDAGSNETARLLDPSGSVGKSYHAMTTPHMFIIDAEGTLVYQGAIDDNSSAMPETVDSAKNYVRAALADLKAGNAVQMAETKPYGCSVKYKMF